MFRLVAAAVALALGAGVVQAQNTAVIKQRQELMKGFGQATRAPTGMVKGEAPFELAKVKASLKVFQENAAKLKTLWPADSKTGENTRALPKIWADKDFLTWFDGLAKDAKAAEASIKDEASLKTEWPKLVDYCGSCHKDYRAPAKN